ncbi:MAG: phosphatidylserine/phosphatidylglycerophosphate/cardiolipin synthase family protein, partial [Verrucomicrobiales bacterium]|nr:phosphatidylserine/phosphatidylglycerophosphate/cardiolipin synthase family protein [Verrucomicrobiales bacterium]
MTLPSGTRWTWLRTGREAFAAMLDAIESARRSVCLEMYIFAPGPLGERFRQTLIRARQRGAAVRVLVDAIGSLELPDDFWTPLREVGGEARIFNPISLKRLGIRNHRKLLVCDNSVAFIGGFNIAPEYDGDGITEGWRDLGMRLEGPLAAELAATFDDMFGLADFRHKAFPRLRRAALPRPAAAPGEQILLGQPGFGRNPLRRALRADLRRARRAQFMVAYFLPPPRLLRLFQRTSRRGAEVQLILPARSDVALSQMAARSQYRRLLNAGVVLYEYEPQVLHAKLFILDDAVYVGSANLDPRSLSVNYELTIRFEHPQMAAEARDIFANALAHC